MRTTARVLLIACTIVLAAPGTLLAKSAPAAIHDHDFGCELRADSLHPWNPAPMAIPRGVSAKFKLLKAVRSAAESGPGGCTRLPPLAVLARKPGQGNVQWVDFVVATEDVKVYRAFSKGRFDCGDESPAAKFGAWWSFERPESKHAFRADNAVCNAWNDFSQEVVCTLKAGTVIAVGPTQAARCEPAVKTDSCRHPSPAWPHQFKANNHHQIFLNLRNRSPQEIGQLLKNCQVTAWPGRE